MRRTYERNQLLSRCAAYVYAGAGVQCAHDFDLMSVFDSTVEQALRLPKLRKAYPYIHFSSFNLKNLQLLSEYVARLGAR